MARIFFQMLSTVQSSLFGHYTNHIHHRLEVRRVQCQKFHISINKLQTTFRIAHRSQLPQSYLKPRQTDSICAHGLHFYYFYIHLFLKWCSGVSRINTEPFWSRDIFTTLACISHWFRLHLKWWMFLEFFLIVFW